MFFFKNVRNLASIGSESVMTNLPIASCFSIVRRHGVPLRLTAPFLHGAIGQLAVRFCENKSDKDQQRRVLEGKSATVKLHSAKCFSFYLIHPFTVEGHRTHVAAC